MFTTKRVKEGIFPLDEGVEVGQIADLKKK